jgi:hypothetical protein
MVQAISNDLRKRIVEESGKNRGRPLGKNRGRFPLRIGDASLCLDVLKRIFLSTVEGRREHSIRPCQILPTSSPWDVMHDDTCPRLAGLVSDGYFSGVWQDIAQRPRGRQALFSYARLK